MRLVGLGMADGQIEQADTCLCLAHEYRKLPGGLRGRDPLVAALEHLRSACAWLRSVAALSASEEKGS